MNPMIRRCAVLCTALLTACAPIAPRRDAGTAPSFELIGRIVVRDQERGFSSALRWQQSGRADEIWLTAPLGQTIAYLRADGGEATLTASDQKQYHANSIESLTRSALGWRFPVSGMRHWVLGKVAPGMTLAGVERDDGRRLLRFTQDAWQVTLGYPAADGEARPSRIEVAGAGAEIRLVIDSLALTAP